MEFEIKKGETRYYKIIAKEGKKIIGRVWIYFVKNDLHEEPYALIEDLFVEEGYRGKGIGTSLVKRAIEVAKRNGCYKVILTSRFSRPEVHRFYEKLGFKRWGYEFRIDLRDSSGRKGKENEK